MAIVNLDKLLEEQEPVQFMLFGKTYTISDTSYGLTRELNKIRKKMLSDSIEEDQEAFLDFSSELIRKVIPEMEKDTLEKAKGIQIRRINDLINEVLSGGVSEEKGEEELSYYRDKYKDEFRKKGQGTKERRNI